jgi:hypothetical protein
MATPQDLSSSFSFIKRLLADPVLQGYGDNALPLYAVGLYLGVEDFATFATASLTDHPDDKKADIIYIDEAEGVALIAQGKTAKDWGKKEADANKANDLNTAAAWLLQQPIDDVPVQIRQHAKLLREALQKQTIKRIVFAYAHNSFESQNVQNALDGVKNLVSSLPLAKDVDVETVEIGLRQTEQLSLSATGTIQIVAEIDLVADDVISRQKGDGWEAYVFSLNGSFLQSLYEQYGKQLFSANLRDYLGSRKSAGNVNRRIQETAENHPGKFFVFNNGITVVTRKVVPDPNGRTLRLYGLSIVNGAQTTGAIHGAGAEHAKNISVLARVITVDSDSTIPEIVAGNNTQNEIIALDRKSNDPVQVRIAQEFEAKGIDYVHRRDSMRKSKTTLIADQVGQALCAFSGDLQTAIRAKAEIFELEATYDKVFTKAISVGHIFAVQTLAWAFDEIKADLKAKSAAGTMTDVQSRQYRLLEYSASKQFVICVAGALREEIAGTAMPDPKTFDFRDDKITADPAPAVSAWVKVLRAVLPTMSLNLPAEAYEVVRSTEHTLTVIKNTKGIVAGTEAALDPSFQDMRALLWFPKPPGAAMAGKA